MTLRSALAAAAVLAAIAVPLGNTAANAATPHHNVLRGFCGAHLHTSCVADADNDEGVFTVRNAAGHLVTFGHSMSRIARYLDKHATPCVEEDSARCWWNAGVAGNKAGDSFLVIGGHAEGTGSVFYLGDFS